MGFDVTIAIAIAGKYNAEYFGIWFQLLHYSSVLEYGSLE